jgi:general secretion pathway protein D
MKMKNIKNNWSKFWLICAGSLVLFSAEALAEEIKPHSWNLQNVPIQSVIEQVSKETGINFMVDPKVKGEISLISAKELKGDELYQVFLSMLQVLGYAAIPGDAVTKIVPEASAKSMEIPLATDASPGEGDEMVVRVIELHNVTAPGLVPVLRSLVSNQGHLAAFSGSNVIVVADRAKAVSRLVEVIRSIDQADSGGIEHIPLHHASASELVNTLNALYQRRGGDPSINLVAMAADDRSNTLLLSGDRKSRIQLRALIAQLDVPSQGGGNTEVIYLRFQKAEDLVPVLGGLLQNLGSDPSKAGAAGATPAGAVPVPQRYNAQGSGNSLSPASQFGSNNIGQRSGEMRRTESEPSQGAVSVVAGGNGVFAERNTNALVVTATPSLMRNLKSVIAKLDVRRAQVLVEAIIVEISSTTSQDFGVEWRTSGSASGGTSFPAGQSTGTGVLDSQQAAIAGEGINPLVTSGLTMGFIRGGNIRALLHAFSGDSHVNVLSTPSLVALDNKEAQIKVGESIPFPSAEYVSSSTTPDNPIRYFDYRDVGLALYIRPQITKGNAIQFDIEQKVDALGTRSPDGPTTTNREIKTTVLVNDGDILVLGGLIKTENSQSVNKVPFLGDIPLIGNLFKARGDSLDKTNLMVFLRPVILRDGQDGLLVTGGKYDFMRDQEILLNAGIRGNVYRGPVLLPLANADDISLPEPFA